MKKTTGKKTAAAPAPGLKNPVKSSGHATQPPVIRITVRADIGFGNELAIRGNGAGLSWDKGVAMNCTGADLWSITLIGACTPVAFKVLVNDITWSTGEDFIALPGTDVTVTPAF